MKILGIIPARYASTRFPAKPLADIGGKSMIRRVYEQAKKARQLTKVIVATDHSKIAEHVLSFEGEVCLTAEHHPSGTDRCFEVLTKQQDSYDYVVNIQGDEPFIAPEQIDLLASLLDGTTELATLIKVIEQEDQLFNPNVVRVVTNNRQEAVYFTRATIPYLRNIPPHEWLSNYTFYKHIGMYAYRADILQEITKLEQSSLEKAESLEQLRWVENGYRIKVGITQTETMGIDTPEDLERALTHVRGY